MHAQMCGGFWVVQMRRRHAGGVFSSAGFGAAGGKQRSTFRNRLRLRMFRRSHCFPLLKRILHHCTMLQNTLQAGAMGHRGLTRVWSLVYGHAWSVFGTDFTTSMKPGGHPTPSRTLVMGFTQGVQVSQELYNCCDSTPRGVEVACVLWAGGQACRCAVWVCKLELADLDRQPCCSKPRTETYCPHPMRN